MSSTTDPTVALPTVTGTDDDDDDDDVSSSLLPSQPPAATSPPAPTPPLVEPAVPGTPSVAPAPTAIPAPTQTDPISHSILPSSVTGLVDSLPSGSPTDLSPTDPANDGGGGGISAGASAGIGIGVALIVCLAAFGMWFFLRRRKVRGTKTRSTWSHSTDEEHAQEAHNSEVYVYGAGGPAEVSGDEKPRRWSELESPMSVMEVGDGQAFRAELPGSAVPMAATGKGLEDRLFSDPPIDEVDEPVDVQERTVDKKDERLFSDPPIDEGTDTLDSERRKLKKKSW